MQGVAKRRKCNLKPFDKLGRDPISLIMQELPIESAVALGSTDKRLNAILSNQWNQFLKRDYGYTDKNSLEMYKSEHKYKDMTASDGLLVECACHGDLFGVKFCLKEGVDSDCGALDLAAKGGFLEIVKLLLDDSPRTCGWALKGALSYGRDELAQYLLLKKLPERSFGQYLSLAVRYCSIETFKLVLNDKRLTGFKYDVLNGAVWRGNPEIVKLLMKKCSFDWRGAFNKAVYIGRVELVKILRPSIECIDLDVIQWTLDKGHTELFNILTN